MRRDAAYISYTSSLTLLRSTRCVGSRITSEIFSKKFKHVVATCYSALLLHSNRSLLMLLCFFAFSSLWTGALVDTGREQAKRAVRNEQKETTTAPLLWSADANKEVSDQDQEKIRILILTCRWFLTVGILPGIWWDHHELRRGGWWFRDPVENASFMPWVLATAQPAIGCRAVFRPATRRRSLRAQLIVEAVALDQELDAYLIIIIIIMGKAFFYRLSATESPSVERDSFIFLDEDYRELEHDELSPVKMRKITRTMGTMNGRSIVYPQGLSLRPRMKKAYLRRHDCCDQELLNIIENRRSKDLVEDQVKSEPKLGSDHSRNEVLGCKGDEKDDLERADDQVGAPYRYCCVGVRVTDKVNYPATEWMTPRSFKWLFSHPFWDHSPFSLPSIGETDADSTSANSLFLVIAGFYPSMEAQLPRESSKSRRQASNKVVRKSGKEELGSKG
ncbi:unnamed protein product [Lupinus luteus]|uniref:Cytochrome c assembly protein domain-containing protein n=1 Tax=Lupinus luteus TaxID=3873 RepID=A0AAV1YGZ0_LUPLU